MMFNKFFREIRGRFELTQQQAIGSLLLFFFMVCFVCTPIIYRYFIIKPITVELTQQDNFERNRATEISHKKVVQKKGKVTFSEKKHVLIKPLRYGEEVVLPKVTKIDYYKRKKEPKELIQLNIADTTQLKSVRGIGSFFAKRIIKYRDRLGGFTSFKQLDSVYKLPLETKNNLIARLDTSKLVPYNLIDINNVSFKQLLSRKILNYEEVKQVFRYRDKTIFYTKNDLYKIGIDTNLVNVLLDYVEIVQ